MEAFVGAGEDFLSVFETERANRTTFLIAMLDALPPLYAAALSLPSWPDAEDENVGDVSRENQKRLDILSANIESHLAKMEIAKGGQPARDERCLGMTHSEWWAKYELMKRLLGSGVSFWTVDALATEAPEPEVAELADMLVDIYRDLKYSLGLREAGYEEQEEWAESAQYLFGMHWGEHALDSMKLLHLIAFTPPRGQDAD